MTDDDKLPRQVCRAAYRAAGLVHVSGWFTPAEAAAIGEAIDRHRPTLETIRAKVRKEMEARNGE
jgi:hypothetical protein